MSICPRYQDASELTQCHWETLKLGFPCFSVATSYTPPGSSSEQSSIQNKAVLYSCSLGPLYVALKNMKKSHTSCIRPYNFALNNFNSTTMFYQFVITYIINKISTSIQKIKTDIKDTVTFHNKLYNLVPENPFTIHSNISFKNIFQCSIQAIIGIWFFLCA